MKWVSALALPLLSLLLLSSPRPVSADDVLDDEDDSGEGAADGAGAGAPVEDFDIGMPEDERILRMKICMSTTGKSFEGNQDAMAERVQEMMRRQPDMKAEQAINTIFFSMTMTCYMNIEEEDVAKVATGGAISEESLGKVFSHRIDRPQQVHQASKRQWELLQKVLESQAQGQEGSRQGQRSGRQADSRPPKETSSSTQVVFLVVVFATILGVGALAVILLQKAESAGEKNKAPRKEKEKKKRQ